MSEPVTIHIGDVLDGLAKIPDGSVHCCVTSPPYWGLRDYGTATWEGGDAGCDHRQQLGGEGGTSAKQNTSAGTQMHQYRGRCKKCGAQRIDSQIGLEPTPDEFIARMVEVFAAVRRVLREDGTLWLNLGDSYANDAKWGGTTGGKHVDEIHGQPIGRLRRDTGLKPKDLCMMPWRVAMALQADGWWLRSVICWAKKSPMPESVTDRPTSSWEPIFLLAKSATYFYDAEAVKEKGADGNAQRTTNHYDTTGRSPNDGGNRGLDALAARMRDGDHSTRNQRNVWHLGPEPYREAHFATFPTEIPRRAIKAGTSEKGCCAACGAPWVRVVSVEYVKSPVHGEGSTTGKPDCPHGMTGMPRLNKKTGTTGWEPGCTCGAGVVPCMVLDPFLGSGTTVAVARELGRHGVGCELNPEYAALARERIGKAERPATFRSDRISDEGAGLFAGKEGA